MIALGACAAVIDDGKILLTKREDFEVWCLPGGHVEDGESMARAAVRETLEETGVEIELSHLVGLYYRQHNWNGLAMHVACFAARPVGGSLRPQLEEVLELRYCAPDALPAEILSGHRRRIADLEATQVACARAHVLDLHEIAPVVGGGELVELELPDRIFCRPGSIGI